MAQNIYDNDDFMRGYSQLARAREGLAASPEWHTLKSMLPELKGTRVLDLGCGFGHFSRWAAEQGAKQIVAVDLSETMLARARADNAIANVTFVRADIAAVEFANRSFDVVFSALALHYIEDYAKLVHSIATWLVPGGSLVFSVEHPIFSAPTQQVFIATQAGEVWPLDHYLVEGSRTTNWFISGVVKFHRTVAGYLSPLIANGFSLVRIEEWGPNDTQLRAHPEWQRELHRPPFLLLAARRNAEDC